jgi:hypothetical protein
MSSNWHTHPLTLFQRSLKAINSINPLAIGVIPVTLSEKAYTITNNTFSLTNKTISRRLKYISLSYTYDLLDPDAGRTEVRATSRAGIWSGLILKYQGIIE